MGCWRLGVLICAVLALGACGGGGSGIDNGVIHPTFAPNVTGQVDARGVSTIRAAAANDDLYVRVVVANPNPNGADIAFIRYCLKFDPQEDSPLTTAEATGYMGQPQGQLPENIDVQQVGYSSNPQVIEITQFRSAALSPNERYWISAEFIAQDGVPGPATVPQRFKLIYHYQLVEPPTIGILKIFEGTVYDHDCARLPNAFVQYFHKGQFLEAAVTDDNGYYYFEVTVPNPEGASAVRATSCEESDEPTDCVLRVYHPYYTEELEKYLLPEYTHYYVDFRFPWELYDHDQGSGGSV
jgi:hypothetical protein